LHYFVGDCSAILYAKLQCCLMLNNFKTADAVLHHKLQQTQTCSCAMAYRLRHRNRCCILCNQKKNAMERISETPNNGRGFTNSVLYNIGLSLSQITSVRIQQLVPAVHFPLSETKPNNKRTIPAFAFPAEAVPHLPTPEGWKAELARVSLKLCALNECVKAASVSKRNFTSHHIEQTDAGLRGLCIREISLK